MSDRFSLKDHLFNADSLGDLAAEYAAGLPGFDAVDFLKEVVPGLQGRELMQRLDWIADCVQARLAPDFPTMADQVQAAMPSPLDPTKTDDDFGRFIHAVPGILAVRHGLEDHRARAMDLLHAATRRFSMEFYIRPFINRWPDETLKTLRVWADDPNYHVRRLVSEGTRPRLPWAKSITLDPLAPLDLLDRLHADPTRFVTRSVSNHLNDISKIAPDRVLDLLSKWQKTTHQKTTELDWMARHALRTLIKQGHEGAMAHLGYQKCAKVQLEMLKIRKNPIKIGEVAEIEIALMAQKTTSVIVDYLIEFHKPDNSVRKKVFKLKQAEILPNKPLNLIKRHRFKRDATTFRLYPGPHRLLVQVNGRILGSVSFELVN